MSDDDYKYTTTKPASGRDDYRMRLFIDVYTLWVKAQSDGQAISGPKTEAAAAVSAFDDQFPESVVKGEQ